ncbi:hypothetical protein EP57_09180 [Listeria booriae]|uniref:Uncharacterized protein n=1 Tax=Listeria booriae TaxID=1552123 RepID=A0A099W6U1_9LIST|nr:hypothetical protein EP57_09180 [Listeria booriae]
MRKQTGDTYVCQIKNQKTPWIFWFFIFPRGVDHRRSKSATSARNQRFWWTSGSHIRKYAPLPASTKIADCKRFRSICVKQDFSSYPKKLNGWAVFLYFELSQSFLFIFLNRFIKKCKIEGSLLK